MVQGDQGRDSGEGQQGRPGGQEEIRIAERELLAISESLGLLALPLKGP